MGAIRRKESPETTPHAAIIVASGEPVRVFPRNSVEQAKQAVIRWYGEEGRNGVYINSHNHPGPDPNVATFDKINKWYHGDDNSYYIDIIAVD